MNTNLIELSSKEISFEEFKKGILEDYKLACISRQASLLLRKEVLGGRAKFAIYGDGKEIPQIALSKIFRKGDLRSGYYRDQTLLLAMGALKVRHLFSQCYAHSDINADPCSAGRMMNCHFSTALLDEKGEFKDLTQQKNSIADLSPTGAQMPRLLGLAQASKLYKENKALEVSHKNFTSQGQEIAFGTIGNASSAEGLFWETINAAGVLQVPLIISIWDDEYGISVPNEYQFFKKSLADILKGFERSQKEKGFEIISVKGWDYSQLIQAYEKAEKIARYEQIPVIVYVEELTQPQGHSTSGSHERYKSKERLEWERQYDCLKKFKEWILTFEIQEEEGGLKLTTQEELEQIEIQAKAYVKKEQEIAWNDFYDSLLVLKKEVLEIIESIKEDKLSEDIKNQIQGLKTKGELSKKKLFSLVRNILYLFYGSDDPIKERLNGWFLKQLEIEKENYSSHLYSNLHGPLSDLEQTPVIYKNESREVDGRIILRDNFDALLSKHPDLIVLGEDVGKIGDVNQGLEGLQLKYGKHRISDTGIREATIIGQGMGLALRGFRPIVEIQYLDYIFYATSALCDDLSTLHYRTKGRQKAPLIIRTRGHRLEGIWHSGSPMGGLVNLLRGMLILVPRNMSKAAGFYNALLKNDHPALVIECLNGYRLKEPLMENLGMFTTPIGEVEVIREGKDITILSYGSTLRLVRQAAHILSKLNIDIQIIDVQSLLPFDLKKDIVRHLKKTNRLAIVDEDVPGGASAYILEEVLEKQDGYHYLDSKPITITAKAHRPAYGTDGDYFSKPSIEDIVENIYALFHESHPKKYPL